VKVRVKPLKRFTKEESEAIDEAAERYGRFLGVAVAVTRDR
jgi:hypothetical protein